MRSTRLVANSLRSTISAGIVLGSLMLGAPDALAQKSQKGPKAFAVVPISVTWA